MNLGEQIEGWAVLAAFVCGLAKLHRDYEKIGAPTESDEDPFDTPELRASRADVEARMKKLGISTDDPDPS